MCRGGGGAWSSAVSHGAKAEGEATRSRPRPRRSRGVDDRSPPTCTKAIGELSGPLRLELPPRRGHLRRGGGARGRRGWMDRHARESVLPESRWASFRFDTSSFFTHGSMPGRCSGTCRCSRRASASGPAPATAAHSAPTIRSTPRSPSRAGSSTTPRTHIRIRFLKRCSAMRRRMRRCISSEPATVPVQVRGRMGRSGGGS